MPLPRLYTPAIFGDSSLSRAARPALARSGVPEDRSRRTKPRGRLARVAVLVVVLAGLAVVGGLGRLLQGEVALSHLGGQARRDHAGVAGAVRRSSSPPPATSSRWSTPRSRRRCPGRIAEIFVEEGDTIEKGARVARLEDVDFKTALATSRAHARRGAREDRRGTRQPRRAPVQIERETPLVEKGVTAKATLDDLRTPERLGDRRRSARPRPRPPRRMPRPGRSRSSSAATRSSRRSRGPWSTSSSRSARACRPGSARRASSRSST